MRSGNGVALLLTKNSLSSTISNDGTSFEKAIVKGTLKEKCLMPFGNPDLITSHHIECFPMGNDGFSNVSSDKLISSFIRLSIMSISTFLPSTICA